MSPEQAKRVVEESTGFYHDGAQWCSWRVGFVVNEVPWKWSELPGLDASPGYAKRPTVSCFSESWRAWLTSERIPEPRKP